MSMMPDIRIGFVPLLDSAILVGAVEKGFTHAEGLNVMLSREPSWSSVRDRLAVGSLDAAHMLAPMPIARLAAASCRKCLIVRRAIRCLAFISFSSQCLANKWARMDRIPSDPHAPWG